MSEKLDAIKQRIADECGLKGGPIVSAITTGAGIGLVAGSKAGKPIQTAVITGIGFGASKVIEQIGDIPECAKKIKKEEATKVEVQKPTPPPKQEKYSPALLTNFNTRQTYSYASSGRDSMMSGMMRRGW